ncbi:MAG TPA: polysaccharide deacetylase family protein [Thermoanaerobaculia bacterium]|nr:polysaccharide deacetylase family protein [Thermoanaerobaculia bacterium]
MRSALLLASDLLRRLCLTRPVQQAAAPLLAGHRGRGACLLYHRLHAAAHGAAEWGNAALSVSTADFERQIHWLARHRRCLPLDEAITLLLAGRLPDGAAVVTFDDGYRDNLELALPILERHGVPAGVFVATGLLDAATDPWWLELESLLAGLGSVEVELDGWPRRWRLRSANQRRRAFEEITAWGRCVRPQEVERLLDRIRAQARPAPRAANPMLTWEQLARFAQHPLITVGAHTVSHPPLSALPPDDARREIAESKLLLESRAAARVEHFAYPFGGRAQLGLRESELAAAAGFRSAFTALEGHLHGEHARYPQLLPRFPIVDRDGLLGLRFKLSGWRALLKNRGARLVTV